MTENNEIYYTLDEASKLLDCDRRQIISYAKSSLCKLSLRKCINVNQLDPSVRDLFDSFNEDISPHYYVWDKPEFVDADFKLLNMSLIQLFEKDKANVTYFEKGGQIYIVDGTKNQAAEKYEGSINVFIDDVEISRSELNKLNKILDDTNWEKKYKELKEESAKILDKKNAEIDNLKNNPQTPINKSAETNTRNKLLTLVIGMAIDKYGYKTDGKNSLSPKKIEGALLEKGLKVTDDTIRNYLNEAKEVVSDDLDIE